MRHKGCCLAARSLIAGMIFAVCGNKFQKGKTEKRMGKISVLTMTVLLGIALAAHAQYGGDPNSSYVDQMVKDHIDQRRAAQTRRSTAKASSRSRRKHRSSSAAPSHKAKAATTPLLGAIALSQDMYSSFGNSDTRDFTLEVRLSPTNQSGKTLVRWARFAPSKGNRSVRIGGIPPGRYIVSTRVISADKRVTPTLLGTQCGEPSSPNGGDFAATQLSGISITKDDYGKQAIVQEKSLWFRPL